MQDADRCAHGRVTTCPKSDFGSSREDPPTAPASCTGSTSSQRSARRHASRCGCAPRSAQVVAFRTFLRTLIHELCHHLDYELFLLEETFHTEGFYKRESSPGERPSGTAASWGRRLGRTGLSAPEASAEPTRRVGGAACCDIIRARPEERCNRRARAQQRARALPGSGDFRCNGAR